MMATNWATRHNGAFVTGTSSVDRNFCLQEDERLTQIQLNSCLIVNLIDSIEIGVIVVHVGGNDSLVFDEFDISTDGSHWKSILEAGTKKSGSFEVRLMPAERLKALRIRAAKEDRSPGFIELIQMFEVRCRCCHHDRGACPL